MFSSQVDGAAVHGKEQVIALDAEYMNQKHSWVRRAQTIWDKIGFAAQAQIIFTVGFFELYFASHRKKWDAENLERAHHIIAL